MHFFLNYNKNLEGKYILSILNSKPILYWIHKSVYHIGEKGYELLKQYVEIMPIPKASPKQQKTF